MMFAFVTAVIAVLMVSRLDKRNVILDSAIDPGPLGGRFYEDESGREVVYRVERLPAAHGVSASPAPCRARSASAAAFSRCRC